MAWIMRTAIGIMVLVALQINGCAGIGAYTVVRDSFGSVRFRNLWFRIYGQDYLSKNMFTFLMLLFLLAETRGHQAVSIVTGPTN